MPDPFFDHPVLNSPYEYPRKHWELDADGQPTQQQIERRRRAEFLTPIPKPKKRRATVAQQDIVFDEGLGLSTAKQQYDPTSRAHGRRRRARERRTRRLSWPLALDECLHHVDSPSRRLLPG
jgi:type III restriction enzyme